MNQTRAEMQREPEADETDDDDRWFVGDLFQRFAADEFFHDIVEKMNFDGISRQIVKRKRSL